MSIEAVRVHTFTDPPTIVVERIDAPMPAAGEIVVDVAIASLNPVDRKTAAGKYKPVGEDRLPLTLGRDLAGTIAKLGDGVEGWSQGARVCAFISDERGAQAEEVVVKVEELVRIPDGVSEESAGAIPLAAMTAWQGLFDHGRLTQGQRVLIHGGAGGVGHIAVQLAKWTGCEVFTTVSEDDLDFARALGADTAIDFRNERFEDIATDLDLVFDTQGGEVQQRSFACVKPGGALISTLDPDEAKAAELGIRTVPRWHAHPDAGQLGQVLDLIANGKVRVEVARRFPLDAVKAAQDFAASQHPRGKVVLTVA